MANTTVNKVILGNETLLDLTADTATAADVVEGKTFHLASGAAAVGTASIPEPSSTTPAMDGTAAVGTATTYARADHVHPTDTSRQAALSVETGTLSKGSAASSYTGQVRKYGHVVQLNINQLRLASAIESGRTSGTVTTIPSGYRPSYTLYVPWTSSGAAYGYANITTGGTVTMRNCSAVSLATSAASAIACTYIIN